MTPSSETDFKQNYQAHLKHLKLKGLQPKTVEAYARGIRRLGEYFDYQIHELSEAQLLEYFTDLLETRPIPGAPLNSTCTRSNSSTGPARTMTVPG